MDTTTTPTTDHQPPQPLHRPYRDRMVAGVAAGLADYLGVEVTIARIALAVLAVIGPGVPLYLAGWLLIPDEGAEQSLAMSFIHPTAPAATR
jgi:phage shock protein PspC (stress-responsive transcriptional regulator)